MENSVGGREGGDGMNCLVVPGVVSAAAAVGGGGKKVWKLCGREDRRNRAQGKALFSNVRPSIEIF